MSSADQASAAIAALLAQGAFRGRDQEPAHPCSLETMVGMAVCVREHHRFSL